MKSLANKKSPIMKDLIKTSRASSFIQSGGRTKFVRGGLGRAIYIVLLGIMAGVSQTALAEDPAELFVKTCAACHGKDGKAQTPAAKKLGVKDLSLSKLTDAQIVQQVTEGKQATQSSSKMAAFKEKISPEQIQSLVPVVKEFRK
jgi:mono/diheme cytochrome c family protein